ncbi:MAG: hypothetical protein CVU56_04865 [Deltaproteobacteria bacterium HGW-Deltaproteobacteria-14]|nr:MAG: hypothetical protein CVU56_04865 [Deltaproteobacteria bacterium HGW-Deltaproteobacteria-14]
MDGGGGAPLPFPPPATERQTRLREVYVADLDGDGRHDVLLANGPDAAGDTGVYVTLGGPGARPTRYDAFVTTRGVPVAVTVASLTGGALPDLVTFSSQGERAFVEVHPQTGPARFGTPLVRETTPAFAPRIDYPDSSFSPVVAAALDLTADGVADLLLIDRLDSFYLAPTAWESQPVLQGPIARLPYPDDGWNVVVDAFVSVDDDIPPKRFLAVLEGTQHIAYFEIAPTTGVAAPAERVSTGAEIRGVARADLDGDGRDEVIGASGRALTALNITPPSVDAHVFRPDLLNPKVPDESIDGVAALDVGGDGAPEIILLDAAPAAGGTSQLLVIRDPYVDGDSALTSSWTITGETLTTRPALMAVGRLDDDGAVEVFLYGLDGVTECRKITIAADVNVEGCP